jgi:membrane-associated phospholipid phosphatase
METRGMSWMMGVIIAFTILFPIVSLFIMKKSGIIEDFQVNTIKERMPVLMSSFIYLIVFYFLIRSLEFNTFQIPIFGMYLSVISGGILLAFVSVVITYFWKISLHTTAIAGLAGAFVALTQVLIPIANIQEVIIMNSLLLLVVGMVAFSRLYLQAHNYLQVIAGMIMGFSLEFLCVRSGFIF